jgi:hypothetical protein
MLLVFFLSLAVTFSASAQDSDRLGQLEKEMRDIQLLLSKLEALLDNPSKAQELAPSSTSRDL